MTCAKQLTIAGWCVAVLLIGGMLDAHAQPSRGPLGRPRVGVALGGGTARGIAHVGVLRWLEFGLKRGIVPPPSLNNGQQVDLLLARISAPYYGVDRFDQLPTPFSCVAVDLRTARSSCSTEGLWPRPSAPRCRCRSSFRPWRTAAGCSWMAER